jgi:hypothetical protein
MGAWHSAVLSGSPRSQYIALGMEVEVVSKKDQITFDIVVSGCATECWHCYVDGGRTAFMDCNDYERILNFANSFRRLAASQHVEVSPYLDLEPMLHPDVVKIIRAFVRQEGFTLPSCIPTSGMPLAKRDDWRELLAVYWEAGVRELMFTLHGPDNLHDCVVSADGASACQRTAVGRAREYDFTTRLNLMVSRPMLRRFDETKAIVEKSKYDLKEARVPAYAPNAKLRKFEPHRPRLSDLKPHIDYLSSLGEGGGQVTDDWSQINECTEEWVFADMMMKRHNYDSYESVISRLPNWRFVTVGPGLDIWYGNGRHRTHLLGRVGDTLPRDLLRKVRGQHPNYALGGFFEIDHLPSPVEVASTVADPAGQRVYSDPSELQVKWLDQFSRSADQAHTGGPSNTESGSGSKRQI